MNIQEFKKALLGKVYEDSQVHYLHFYFLKLTFPESTVVQKNSVFSNIFERG